MRTEVTFSRCAGKTIEAVAYQSAGPQAIITFTDGTFATIEATVDRDGNADICDSGLKLFDFGDSDLAELGVVTAQELEQRRAHRDKFRDWLRDRDDRQAYEELKKKFEGK